LILLANGISSILAEEKYLISLSKKMIWWNWSLRKQI